MSGWNIAEDMQPLVQISDCNSPQLTMTLLGVNSCRLEIEIRRPLKRKPALADIAFVLGGIEFDLHVFIVYTILAMARVAV